MAKYGPNAQTLRQHHLVPQELLKRPRFDERLSELGIQDAQAFIDRKMALLKHGTHHIAHGGGQYNKDWLNWLDANPNFTLPELETQIKLMMRNYNIPRGSRNFAKQFGSN
jgi:hypothetical protein